ncbi:MAG: cation diffusion facilitator family transporter [Spirochaetia bacterium]|jgi:cation diffusion facilitator family transporter|nr:cation diffusion facilitator family transporter [Spirochaetia bacterium]
MNGKEKIAMKVSSTSIVINLLLSFFKFFAGIFGHSEALISDAIHSASDVFSTIIVMIGIKISEKAPDPSHQYGHEKFESLATIILGIILFLTGLEIGKTGLMSIIKGTYTKNLEPTLITVVAAATSIIIKEAMFWYTRAAAKKTGSSALMADAWHHRSDALSSIGSLAGILFARHDYPVMDPVASLVICAFILKASIDILKDGTDKMVDHSCSDAEIKAMAAVIKGVTGVVRLDSLKTRKFGDRAYVDVEIAADGNLSLYDSHAIAVNVHNQIEENFPIVKHCMVHVNPLEARTPYEIKSND